MKCCHIPFWYAPGGRYVGFSVRVPFRRKPCIKTLFHDRGRTVHVSFGALSIALAMGWSPLKVSIPVVVLAAFFLLRITENSRIKSDAAIAMISASALAIGIIVTSLTTGMTTDVSSYMFGSILAMTKEDMALAVVLSLVVLGLFCDLLQSDVCSDL
mgnify:CR=1 FL=1